MSLWWTKKAQLDAEQLDLIENLPVEESFLVTGPPGCGKTNVLLRRAQYVRSQEMPNVLVLSFTRTLTEFLKTGAFDENGREIFPESCITTLESWIRSLYETHGSELPSQTSNDLIVWKRQLAAGAMGFKTRNFAPAFDALFVDEAQDLLAEEVELLSQWSNVLFFVGDDRQRIFEGDGLGAIQKKVGSDNVRALKFHYRLASEICRAADRILVASGGVRLADTCHYTGPTPGNITIASTPLEKKAQLAQTATQIKAQLRIYADLIKSGDRLAVIVARKSDRDAVFEHFEADSVLSGKSKIIRARHGGSDDYDPSMDPGVSICILTVQGCKGLEFRAVHWLFCDELSVYHTKEHYYTVLTRAKTSLHLLYTSKLPEDLARAHSSGLAPW